MGNERSRPKKRAPDSIARNPTETNDSAGGEEVPKEEESLTSDQKEIQFVQFNEKRQWISRFLVSFNHHRCLFADLRFRKD
jgi:hypothetical protein